MALTSSLVTYYAGTEPTDPETGGLKAGLHPVGTLPQDLDPEWPDADRVVLHVEPGRPVPTDALQVIVDGSDGPWTPGAVASAWPGGSPYVLEATWLETNEDGDEVLQRAKKADVPDGVTVEETDLLPHLWAGQEP